METKQEVEKKAIRKMAPPRGGRRKKTPQNRFPEPMRLQAVKLCEEGLPVSAVAAEMGTTDQTVRKWHEWYKKEGEAGLQYHYHGHTGTRLASPVREKILALKQEYGLFGAKRISQMLKRIFFLKACATTVQKTLKEENLVKEGKKKPSHNPCRPRFFERSTPNQMWQTDIFTFRLGGRYAYLIGFIDDYSRYMTGLGLFRSQTAENLLELYRRSVGEYNVPKEMLTDNGRQYTNWRGTSRFEAELSKDKVKHIKSRPHHPMTLGKIERFWKTIFEEYLVRAQFGSFEEAQERIGLWVKYYNYRRPHQGIGGLCPSDRFFEVASDLKKTMEKGIAENVLEMALRGKPKDPFYMVGRMDGQSVVIRAEKGKLKMSIGEDEKQGGRELEYDFTKEPKTTKEQDNGNENTETKEDGQSQCGGALSGGTLPMDGKAEAGAGMPGTGDKMADTEPLAEPGDRGDVEGAATEGEAGGWAGVGPEVGKTAGATSAEGGGGAAVTVGEGGSGAGYERSSGDPEAGENTGGSVNEADGCSQGELMAVTWCARKSACEPEPEGDGE